MHAAIGKIHIMFCIKKETSCYFALSKREDWLKCNVPSTCLLFQRYNLHHYLELTGVAYSFCGILHLFIFAHPMLLPLLSGVKMLLIISEHPTCVNLDK